MIVARGEEDLYLRPGNYVTVHNLGAVITAAEARERKALDQDLALELTYDPITKVMHARQDFGHLAGRWGYSRV